MTSEKDLKNKRGIIYRIRNLVNGKVYIGSTINSFYKRYGINWHQNRALSSTYLKRSIDKHGVENFTIEIIDESQDYKKLLELESYYIEYYKSYIRENGYNIFREAQKGGGKFLWQYTDEELLNKKIDLLNKFEKIHGDKFFYEDFEYSGIKKGQANKIKIKCKKCNKISKREIETHLKGTGCQKCAAKTMADKRRYAFEYFLKRSKEKFEDEFIYYDYNGLDGKIKAKSKLCGHIFEQHAKNHLNGKGCPKCNQGNSGSIKIIIYKNNKKIKEFPTKKSAAKYLNSLYNFISEYYLNNNKKHKKFQIDNYFIEIIGDKKRTINEIHNIKTAHKKQNYNKQKRKKRTAKVNHNLEYYLDKFNKIHGDKYIYCEFNPNSNKRKTEIEIYCKNCKNVFKQKIRNHIEGKGCSACGIKKCAKSNTYSFDEFINEAQKTHGNRYIYCEENYQGKSQKVKIKDTFCRNIFWQWGYLHLQGYNCPCCQFKDSKGCKKVEMFNNKNEKIYKFNSIIEAESFVRGTLKSKKTIKNIQKRKNGIGFINGYKFVILDK